MKNWLFHPLKLILASFVVTFCFATANAQKTDLGKPVSIDDDKNSNSSPAFNSIEEEMKAKRAIQYEEKEYQENLVRARDLCALGTALATSFKQKNSLDADDLNQLQKVEKLAKGIGSAAGGSGDDANMDNPPKDMPAAMHMLGDLSESLKSKVEKTPKHVISASVIDEANVLLELIRVVRTFPSRA